MRWPGPCWENYTWMTKQWNFSKVENPIEEGLKCARLAVSIDPNCQHGYMALAWIYLFHHNRQASLKAADQAMAINPNSGDIVGAMGFVYVCAGEFEKGFELLKDSVQHNPFCPWWFNHRVCVLLFAQERI